MSSYGVVVFLQVQHFCDLVNVGIPGMCKLSYFFALYLLVFQLWDDMDRRFQFFPFVLGLTNKISKVKPPNHSRIIFVSLPKQKRQTRCWPERLAIVERNHQPAGVSDWKVLSLLLFSSFVLLLRIAASSESCPTPFPLPHPSPPPNYTTHTSNTTKTTSTTSTEVKLVSKKESK